MKKFLKNILSYIKLFIQQKLFFSHYKRVGKCLQCGQCCRHIKFKIRGKFVKTKDEFEALKNYKNIYHHFFISGKDTDNSLLFTCHSLDTNNKCKDYIFRSIYCRKYPQINNNFIYKGGTTLDNCGYEFQKKVEFKNLLKQK